MPLVVKKEQSRRGGEGCSLCLFTAVGATSVSFTPYRTLLGFLPIRGTALFGHHRIHTDSCKPADSLPSHQIPFQPGLHCRAKRVRMFRRTVQQQLSCIIHFFIEKERASLILICRRHARIKKLYPNFAGWIKTLDDLQMLFSHLPLLALR